MKLAIACVAALSLVGCATDEPSDPADGLYGLGIGKALHTEPGEFSPTLQQDAVFARPDLPMLVDQAEWVETLEGPMWEEICAGCSLTGIKLAGIDDLYVFDASGSLIGTWRPQNK